MGLSLRWRVLSRSLHKWISAIVGIQVLIWFVSGFIMAFLDMDAVHGDHLAKHGHARELSLEGLISPSELGLGPGVREIKLSMRGSLPVFIVKEHAGKRVFNAKDGTLLAPVSENEAVVLGEGTLASPAKPIHIELVKERVLEFKGDYPAWRIDYDSPESFSLYISAPTGEVQAVRNTRWRVFDFFWMLHIMDYSERDNVNTPLMRVISFFSMFVALTGLVLVIVSLQTSFKRRRANRKVASA